MPLEPDHNSLSNGDTPAVDPFPQGDQRLYIPEPKVWTARVKASWEKEYCYAKLPGQDYLHLLLAGEIFLESKDERLCLTCALRRGVITTDRLYWQNRPRISSIPVVGL